MTTTSMKTVRFNYAVQVIPILSIYDYTPPEISASWFNQKEMNYITERCVKVIAKMDMGRGNKTCSRGLENHTKLRSMSKMKNRAAAFAAVFEEQDRQLFDNNLDVNAIANAYHRATSSCQMWAEVMGKQDRKAADTILYQDEDDFMGGVNTAVPASSSTKCTKSILRCSLGERRSIETNVTSVQKGLISVTIVANSIIL